MKRILAIVYSVFIVYYTILCRGPGTERIFKPLFWELSRGAWRDISLNIFLFVPLGFLLGDRKGILIGFLFSITIELVQFIFRLGFCEMDDVLNNTIGMEVGVLLFMASQKLVAILKSRYLRTEGRSKNIS